MMVAFIRQRLCEKGFGDVLAYCSATYVPENSIANSCKIISVDWNNDICSRELADCRERQGRVERCSPLLLVRHPHRSNMRLFVAGKMRRLRMIVSH